MEFELVGNFVKISKMEYKWTFKTMFPALLLNRELEGALESTLIYHCVLQISNLRPRQVKCLVQLAQ